MNHTIYESDMNHLYSEGTLKLLSRNLYIIFLLIWRGHSGAVATHVPPTSEVSSSNAGLYVGMLVVAY